MKPQGMRLQKFLSRSGVASRRRAEELIVAGRVRVNGQPATELGIRVDPDRDSVEVDGSHVGPAPPRWVMLNKPRGLLTTRQDPHDSKTVYDCLSAEDRVLPYVGRLDRDTEGLLLFTNEGDVHHALLHPSSGIEREYVALVAGCPTDTTIRRLEVGVELEDGPARAERVQVLPSRDADGSATLSLVLRQGRKREVRRLLAAVGHEVLELRRTRFGPLRLEGIGPGEWRELAPSEVRAIRRALASSLDPNPPAQ